MSNPYPQGITEVRPFNVVTFNVGAHVETAPLETAIDGETVLVRCLNFIGSNLVSLTGTPGTQQQLLLVNSSQVTAQVTARSISDALILGESVLVLSPGAAVAVIWDGSNFVVNE